LIAKQSVRAFENMNTKIAASLFAPVFALAFSAAATAQEAAVQPLELTGEQVTKFIASYPALATSFAAIDPEFDTADPDSLIGQIGLMVEGDPEESPLDKAASGAGYASFDEWGQIAGNILLARLWAQNPPDEAEIAASEADIMAQSDVSEDEKKEMIAGLHQALGSAREQKPGDANIEAVRPFLAQLDETIGAAE
jgi:hypothetical protein